MPRFKLSFFIKFSLKKYFLFFIFYFIDLYPPRPDARGRVIIAPRFLIHFNRNYDCANNHIITHGAAVLITNRARPGDRGVLTARAAGDDCLWQVISDERFAAQNA